MAIIKSKQEKVLITPLFRSCGIPESVLFGLLHPKELADMSFKDKPNTNRILEKLQMKALIVREPHPTGKRAYRIFLTDRGWTLRDDRKAKSYGIKNAFKSIVC